MENYNVGLHIETVHGMFNDVYTVSAASESAAKIKAVNRFKAENDCSGVKVIQVMYADKI